MSVELLQTMSLVSFIIAGVLLLVAAALFFLFNIPKVFGEVTGSTARKAIENIRQQNEQTGNKAYRPSPVNAERGKITDKITPSGNLEQKSGNSGVSVGTVKLQTAELTSGAQETAVLDNASDETTVLTEPVPVGAAVLCASLQQNVNSTDGYSANKNGITVEYEVEFIGSSEIVE